MSNPVESNVTPTGEFRAHFGGPPGSLDAAADCKKWEHLCGELLTERQKLHEELAHLRSERDNYLKAVYYFLRQGYTAPDFTREEVLAHADDEPTIHDLIAELESGVEKPR